MEKQEAANGFPLSFIRDGDGTAATINDRPNSATAFKRA